MTLRKSCDSLVVSFIGLLSLGGCDQATKNETAPAVQAAAPRAELPPSLFLKSSPPGEKSVEEAKASAKKGDEVVLRGRVGGGKSPFVENRAVFTLVGSGLRACSDNPEDKCATPWDYCCETPAEIAKHSATVQVLDSSGGTLRAALRGTNGLNELSDVTVVGKVIDANEKLFVVAASGIYVKKRD